MADRAELLGVAKARMDLSTMLALAVLAGAFIALGGEFFTVVTTESGLGFGLNRLVGGLAFSLGLILVVIGGAELFTGNNLVIMAWASRKIDNWLLLRNWIVVYSGNFLGAVATCLLIYFSGQWKFNDYAVGANAVRIAEIKTNLDFAEAIALGVLCNALVCLAVWLCYSARSNIDKVVSILFPISAFVASGFEHSVANMFFVPMGLLLKRKEAVLAAGKLSQSDVENLTWGNFLTHNLLPVTLGNIVGGAILVGLVYWFIYLRRYEPG